MNGYKPSYDEIVNESYTAIRNKVEPNKEN